MAYELWTSGELYEVLRDTRRDARRTWWLDNYFPNTHLSEKEEIIFSELPAAMRRVAPFVLPTEQGKPIFVKQGETLKAFKPAYIKPKDAVRPTEMRRVMPSEVMNGRQLTMEERFDARVTEIVRFHQDAIRAQWELMAARAVQYGKGVFRYRRDDEAGGSGDPIVTIDFGRDPNLTVTLTSDANWDDVDHDIIGDIQGWRDKMAGAVRGGNANAIMLGTAVVPWFRNNKGVRALLNNQVRGSENFVMQTGFTPTLNDPQQPIVKIADLGEGLSVYSYADTLDNADGTQFPLMDPKSVFMSAPGVDGVKCYGAIYDIDADLQPVDIFVKMFDVPDPSGRFILSQSAPLMIPVNPNRTFTARVL